MMDCGSRQAGTKRGGSRMRIIAPRGALSLICGAIAALGAGQAAAQAPAGDNPALYRGADREQRVLDGARKEGVVTVYSSMIVDQALRPLIDGFRSEERRVG